MSMKIKVRHGDHMVFEVDPHTYEPLHVSYYDPYCYSDPEPDTLYLEEYDWFKKRNKYIWYLK